MSTEVYTEKKPNRLINEKSPYLLQHAYNPVDWFPWSEEAFEKAKTENKPIFLSIGYAACHWCHVMEKECFNDEEVASLLNKAFVCIKVDREERPDLDAIYMAVCQALGRNCGWPLHILMTPRKNPFFAASYIPKNSRGGILGLMELVPQVMEIWETRKAQLEIVGADIRSRVEALEKRIESEEDLGKAVLDDAYEKLRADFDVESGGFGTAPKFPRPHTILFLLRYWKRTGKKEALEMSEKTLRNMRLGGVFDQLGFGFHRYTTDSQWLVPHFEKMLYDQALLALAYTEMYQVSGAEKFKLTAKETLDYVLRDLVSPEGGFYASEDADSEGEEGKFYLWTMEEIKKALPKEEELAVRLFGILPEGNYVDAIIGSRNNKNILHFPQPLEAIASETGLTLDELICRLGKIRNTLFEARKSRIRPTRDEKVLVDWNGLIIAALARANAIFNEEKYLQAATKAANFILSNLRKPNGELCHVWVKGEKAVDGFLDDYAFLTFGLIELYEATFEEKYLQAATDLTNIMMSQFWDIKNGGFYFSCKNAETTMPNMKHVYDGALPSGNSAAVLNLLRLARLMGKVDYEEVARKTLKIFAEEVKEAPQAYTFMLCGLDFALGPAYNVVLAGEPHSKDMVEMLSALRKNYVPNVVISIKQPNQAGTNYEKIDGKTTVYVCRDQTCIAPTTDKTKILELLGLI
ncbi:MAG: thioredoxin domain-containing protein [Candidatus Bathyarchaeota archaeon]|nr:thioredoxin domain-containing protein [Candidatus Bathyarchaeota archaeon]